MNTKRLLIYLITTLGNSVRFIHVAILSLLYDFRTVIFLNLHSGFRSRDPTVSQNILTSILLEYIF